MTQAEDAVHRYSESTKAACLYIGAALLVMVITIAATAPKSPLRIAGKGVAILAVVYSGWVLAKETYLLASDKNARKKSGVVRNIAFSALLVLVLCALVCATVV
tara:strand:- start:1871 stop:2182 length:312 start_codon:yes stop_codon:yes gene_type:complete